PTPGSGSSGKQDEQPGVPLPPRDLNDAISVATALLGMGATGTPDQLAAAMNQTPTSGAFKNKVAAARHFRLISTGQGKYHLTDLGFAITDAARSRAARADAFLRVPVFKRMYDEFRNRQLPPRPAGLEHTFVRFGVASKQKEMARLIFDRSAEQAGYFAHG